MRVRFAGAVLFGFVLSTAAAAAQPPSPLTFTPSDGRSISDRATWTILP